MSTLRSSQSGLGERTAQSVWIPAYLLPLAPDGRAASFYLVLRGFDSYWGHVRWVVSGSGVCGMELVGSKRIEDAYSISSNHIGL